MGRHFLLSMLSFATTQAALSQDCVTLVCAQGDHCEITPSGLTAALPHGLEIRSVRGQTKIATRGEAVLLDCRPVGRLGGGVVCGPCEHLRRFVRSWQAADSGHVAI